MDALTAARPDLLKRGAASRLLVPGLAALVVVLFLLSLGVGPVVLPLRAVIDGLFGTGDEAARLIVREIRLPRAILAVAIGFSLGLAGASLQGLLRNPLASPSLFGAPQSAAFGAVAVIALGLADVRSWALPIAAIAAAFGSVFALLTIACMLALAYLMNYSGMTSTLGLALAASGVAFPFFSAVVGWLGVFLTGSDTSANALFGNLQVVTANAIGLNPVLTASVNSAAGVMGKMISVQSIAVAVAATGMTRDDESRLFRFTIKHSVLLMMAMGVISLLFAYVFADFVPVVPPK